MLYEILPDPRAFIAETGNWDHVLHIHRILPKDVPVGHFEENGIEVVDEVVDRSVYLDRIQQACATLKERLQVRFYDHFEEEFDASILDELGEICSLAIDGLDIVRNVDAIGRLPKLTSLLFGPRRVDDSKVLGVVGVHRFKNFTLAGTPTPAIDLRPLADASSLRSLRLLGHGKNTEAIGHLISLAELAIQPSSKFSLGFISQLVALESLKFVLGNTTSLTAIDSLPVLGDLSVQEVRLLEDLGDLQRFPQLRRLQVSDQPRLSKVRVGGQNVELKHLYLYSVPGLQSLEGFSELPVVESLFAYDSGLNFDWPDLPGTLTHFQLLTKAIKGRNVHAAQVLARGLTPAVHPDATFFYK